jgi:hypothetical protein
MASTLSARGLFALTAGLAMMGCERAPAPAAAPPAAATVPAATRPLEFPGGAGSAQPRLTLAPDGVPVLSWLEPARDAHALKYSRFVAGAFTPPAEVVRGTDFFVNWADLPSVQPITADLWAAHWLKFAADSAGAYHIATSVSADGGATWSDPVQLNDDQAMAEHGFVQLFPWARDIGAFWLDGRQLAEWSFEEPDKLLGTSLRVARLDGAGNVVAREIVDELVCDCCQPRMAMTATGPLVAYRDRTPEEQRDIVVRRHVDGRWQGPVSVGEDGWIIEGCPVNGPAVAAVDERVAVAWFTAAAGKPRVRFAASRDGGATFAPAVDLDAAGAFGQTGLVLGDDGTALVTWWRAAAGGGLDLALRSVGGDGSLGDMRVLAHSDEAQPVDVPQIVRVDSDLLVAWTSLEGEGAVHTLLVAADR